MDSSAEQLIRTRVEALKRIDRFDRLCAALLPCAGHDGYLMPVCDLHRADARLIERLAAWREKSASAFPSQFPVTLTGTGRWLSGAILDNPARLLFLVLDRCGHAVGHVGLTDYLNDRGAMEAENIVRGVTGTAPGLMSRAMEALLDWGHAGGARHFHLRVFEDNAHAVEFYRRLGFRDDAREPLRRQVEGEAIIYRPLAAGDTAPPDKAFLRMVLES